MSTTCYLNRTSLVGALKTAKLFAPKRSPNKAVENIRVSINGAVEIQALDCEDGAVQWIDHCDSMVGLDSIFCVNPHALLAVVDKAPDEIVKLVHEDGKLQVLTQRGKVELATESADEKRQTFKRKERRATEAGTWEDVEIEDERIIRNAFPAMETDNDKLRVAGWQTFDIGPAFLKSLLSATLFCCETESSRYALGGVCFEFSRPSEGDTDGAYIPAHYRGIATDGRRMSVYGDQTFTHEFAPIIPADFCKRLVKLLKGARACKFSALIKDHAADGTALASPFVDLVRFEIDYGMDTMPIILETRLIEGRFPKWREVIPSVHERNCYTFDVPTLLPILADALGFTTDEMRGMDFAFKGGDCTLTGKVADVGSYERVYCNTYCEAETITAWDIRFVLDYSKAMHALGFDKMNVWVGNGELCAMSATLIGSAKWQYVLMPLARDRR